MILKDFIFSYTQSIKKDLNKKKYFKAFRKLFNYPYKLLLDKVRQFLSLKKYNLDKDKENKNLKFLSLDDLFIRFNSDKASEFVMNDKKIHGHNYSPFYEKYFFRYKNKKKISILEIGSLRGAATASFYYYFDNPNIICADINPFQIQVYSKNIRSVFVDTQSNDTLKNLSFFLDQEFDIIIDDGSHNIRDQIITFNIFFRKLKKNGWYVIEDSSQYLSASHLNPDNLRYGTNEIISSVKNKQSKKINYLSTTDIDILSQSIGNIFLEKGNYIENKINISEIIFIEKS